MTPALIVRRPGSDFAGPIIPVSPARFRGEDCHLCPGHADQRTGRRDAIRWAYIRSMSDQIEVDDREIRIHGAEKHIRGLFRGGAAQQECRVLLEVARSEGFELSTCGVKIRFS